ncbi:sigma-70 family RNA polymerase sigma factor [Thalassolituus oleivorans]|uniref:RNA polymerase sigma factor n=1 Tax=Thalassolituus oleivorans MIL-1 TaxID=1298593 RepID=M5E3R8_9GAMM|nr:sigma-70 family RNA polymerase sigma factor [Thalassolituus oleivorans]MBU2097603.1 sigma-70 family RNA polymerase sigma factor [Gammaproteobacteria bacterium]PHQ85753.1 MAG: RNA polymerase subunit sigma-70 [Thalassobium sp.]CCU72164.1 RNA polymerase, sigma-24 subunit, ECF subfamily [Thalassolituus oleivorans MIL-1]
MKSLVRTIRLHEQELRQFIYQRVADKALTDDLTQEVFLRAIAQGNGFSDIQNPRAWLYRVARNVLTDHARRVRPVSELSDDYLQEEHTSDTVDLLSECVERNLQNLAASDRLIIEQCDLKQQTVKDYAVANGLSLPAAKARLLRARQRLRDSIINRCDVRFDELGNVCDYQVPESHGRMKD